MGLLDKLLGPKSKYDKSLPYTYEARVRSIEDEDEFKTYFSDTICGLVEHLGRNGIGPDQAEIFEIYQEHETPVPTSFLAGEDGQWLLREELCRAFERHYPGHIRDGSCDFEDRARGCQGP
ncbi:MAG: hypothetical protein K8F56_11380 [Rhodocyclaceae bacterium]|jgi:hypothetical protein|nr:hypothetical protein [Rhodocyclaceae bacterium]MCC6879648.1 hypothetical protein [Rhodocyclaceae bacterium]